MVENQKEMICYYTHVLAKRTAAEATTNEVLADLNCWLRCRHVRVCARSLLPARSLQVSCDFGESTSSGVESWESRSRDSGLPRRSLAANIAHTPKTPWPSRTVQLQWIQLQVSKLNQRFDHDHEDETHIDLICNVLSKDALVHT